MGWLASNTTSSYFNVFKNAMTSSVALKMFKHHGHFCRPVGVTEHIAARAMLSNINLDVHKFQDNDLLAIPFEKVAGIGTDTIRFIETACFIDKEFGNLKGKVIAELGSNYGGLAYVLLTSEPGISQYYLLDFPLVQQFSCFYLKKLGLESGYTTEEPKQPVDLFISEYSVTEQTSVDQMIDIFNQYGKDAKLGCFIRINIPEVNREAQFINAIRHHFPVTITPEHIIRRPNKILIAKRT